MELVTLNELKTFLGIPLDDISQDAKLTMFKSSVETSIINFCGCSFETLTTEEILDGLHSDVIVTQNTPIQNVETIRVGTNTDGTEGIQLDSSTYYYDEHMIRLRSTYTPKGRAYVYVKYTYGYETVPDDVKLAAMQSVKAELQRYSRNSEDVTSRAKQGESESLGGAWDASTGLPIQIISKLKHYRQIEFPQIGFAQRNI